MCVPMTNLGIGFLLLLFMWLVKYYLKKKTDARTRAPQKKFAAWKGVMQWAVEVAGSRGAQGWLCRSSGQEMCFVVIVVLEPTAHPWEASASL